MKRKNTFHTFKNKDRVAQYFHLSPNVIKCIFTLSTIYHVKHFVIMKDKVKNSYLFSILFIIYYK